MPEFDVDAYVDDLRPLFETLPPDVALGRLVVQGAPAPVSAERVERVLAGPALAGKESLAAGLWLYVDDLDRSHKISQRHEDNPTFCYWHAIMHRREGDFSNSAYWFRRTGKHPALEMIRRGDQSIGLFRSLEAAGLQRPTETPGLPDRLARYDPFAFVKEVEAADGRGQTPPELAAVQRFEWQTLMAWCAAQL